MATDLRRSAAAGPMTAVYGAKFFIRDQRRLPGPPELIRYFPKDDVEINVTDKVIEFQCRRQDASRVRVTTTKEVACQANISHLW